MAILDESSSGGAPGYSVAVKTCLEAGGEGEEDMMKVRKKVFERHFYISSL